MTLHFEKIDTKFNKVKSVQNQTLLYNVLDHVETFSIKIIIWEDQNSINFISIFPEVKKKWLLKVKYLNFGCYHNQELIIIIVALHFEFKYHSYVEKVKQLKLYGFVKSIHNDLYGKICLFFFIPFVIDICLSDTSQLYSKSSYKT